MCLCMSSASAVGKTVCETDLDKWNLIRTLKEGADKGGKKIQDEPKSVESRELTHTASGYDKRYYSRMKYNKYPDTNAEMSRRD